MKTTALSLLMLLLTSPVFSCTVSLDAETDTPEQPSTPPEIELPAEAPTFLMADHFDYQTRNYTNLQRQQLPQYEQTEVHHMIALPENYTADKKWPVIMELTGNQWNYGNGTVEQAHMALSISLGRDYISIVLPYVAADHQHNEVKWWGDAAKTAEYVKLLVPWLSQHYSIDLDNIFLCGFSRGAIGASFIGLYDDEIAGIWKGFITHDHFDGFKAWPEPWGHPLAKYQAEACERLKRVKGRSWLVSHHAPGSYVEKLTEMGAASYGQFTDFFSPIQAYIKTHPNPWFDTNHTDLWPAFDIPEAAALRQWLKKVVDSPRQ